MNKKLIASSIAALLFALGFITYGYAQGRENVGLPAGMPYINQKSNSAYNSMIDLMTNNGFEDMVKAVENRDFNTMNNYMNNITEKDYDSMINIMKENGYEGMAEAMESVGRQNMIQMHNTMGGAQGMMSRNK